MIADALLGGLQAGVAFGGFVIGTLIVVLGVVAVVGLVASGVAVAWNLVFPPQDWEGPN